MTDHAHSVPSQATNVRTTSGARARRATLVTVLEELGYCSIQELAERFGVSEMTIRRDVALLVGTGQVRAFHGAAGSLPPSMLTGVDYTERHSTMNTAKRAIAKHAATLMSRGSVVGIDAGTTGAQLAAVLPTDADLTVVTHSLAAISTLSRFPGVAVIGLGGALHRDSLSFDGASTLSAIHNLSIDQLFLAASGLNERGVFCGTGFEAITKRALTEVSRSIVVIADSSKFARNALVRVCEWAAIDRVVVDDGITDDAQAMLDDHGITVDVVATSGPILRT